MSPDQVHQGLILVGLAAVVFLGLFCWAFEVGSINPLRLLAVLTGFRFLLIALAIYRALRPREETWVDRANREIGKICPPPRKFGTLEGWSWRPILRDPNMTVRVQDRSPDGRHLEGYIIGTPGTLQVACKARTWLRLLDGWITLTSDGDPPITLRAGDDFVVESGFRGQWENETVTHLNFGLVLP